MGSSGSGRLTDYPQTDRTGSAPPEDRCGVAFSLTLDDVEVSEFHQAHGGLPPVGTKLRIAQRKRVVAITDADVTVGNIPTSHNYLAACMKDGWTYVGLVTNSSSGPPVASVIVDFAPEGTP